MEAVDIKQLDTFEAATLFARTEGIIPAPESSHAIAAAIQEAQKAKEASAALFAGNGNHENMPTTALADEDFADGSIDIMSILVKAGMTASRSEARRAVEQGGVTVNGEKVTDIKTTYEKSVFADEFVIKKGKKSFQKITLA